MSVSRSGCDREHYSGDRAYRADWIHGYGHVLTYSLLLPLNSNRLHLHESSDSESVPFCNGISRRLKDAQKAIAIRMAPPKKIRENAKRNASPRAVSDPAESEQLGSLKGERADWSKPFCTGLVKALRPTTPIRNALKSASRLPHQATEREAGMRCRRRYPPDGGRSARRPRSEKSGTRMRAQGGQSS